MKNLNYKDLTAYASAFVSFVIPKIEVEEVILFGSAARNEAAKDSDIDLFFNIQRGGGTEKIIKQELDKFYKSKIAEIFLLKGIKNEISVEVGDLKKWKLKRSIITDGIVLYGRYKETPENKEGFALFTISPIDNITKRNKIIRKLFGRKEKMYETEGIIKEFKGKKLSPTTFIVPLARESEIVKLLSLEKINFNFFEFWTDQIR